jgi:hypothetical protein
LERSSDAEAQKGKARVVAGRSGIRVSAMARRSRSRENRSRQETRKKNRKKFWEEFFYFQLLKYKRLK